MAEHGRRHDEWLGRAPCLIDGEWATPAGQASPAVAPRTETAIGEVSKGGGADRRLAGAPSAVRTGGLRHLQGRARDVDPVPCRASAAPPRAGRQRQPRPRADPHPDDFRATMGADRFDGAVALLRRHGTPDEAALVLGPDASWRNGIDVPVEDGLHAARRHRP